MTQDWRRRLDLPSAQNVVLPGLLSWPHGITLGSRPGPPNMRHLSIKAPVYLMVTPVALAVTSHHQHDSSRGQLCWALPTGTNSPQPGLLSDGVAAAAWPVSSIHAASRSAEMWNITTGRRADGHRLRRRDQGRHLFRLLRDSGQPEDNLGWEWMWRNYALWLWTILFPDWCVSLLGLPQPNTADWVRWTTETHSLTVLEASVHEIKVSAGLEPSETSLACRRLSSPCVFLFFKDVNSFL